MQKMNGKTANIVDENIAKLKVLFPEAFTEGKIDFEMLQKLLGKNIETEKERYSFTWNGKSEAIKIALKQSTGTLRPDKESSKNWDTTQNLYIEGDNLEVLRLLQNPYRGKVKMIYIDPPYNTGKDFVYTDKFNDTVEDYKERVGETQKTNADTSGRYHTNWLNMMYPRLKLARNLLSDDGVIFISIDDNEQSNLKRICDEIFGEENFIATISNINNPKGRSDDNYIATAHEYILLYAKTIESFTAFGFEAGEEILKRYNKFDEDAEQYREMDLRKTGDGDLRKDRPNLFYYFLYNSSTNEFYPSRNANIPEGFIQIKPIRKDGKDGRWRWGLDTVKENLSELMPKFMPNREIWGVFEKDYLKNRGLVKATSAWSFKDVNSERGSEEFIKLGFDKEVFPKPKPLGVIKRVSNISMNKGNSEIILDFFSGSASTAQATLQLNAEDDGNRKFIMVQLPEKTDEKSAAYKAGYETISKIGMERIRRAGDNIVAELKEKKKDQSTLLDDEQTAVDPDKLDIGFKVFKLDSTNLSIWDEKTDDLEKTLLENIDAIKNGRSEEDVLYEVLIKYGIDLTVPIEEKTVDGKKVYMIADGYLTICLEDNLDLAFIEKLTELKPHRVVFRDTGFIDDAVKTNAEMTLKKHGVEDIKVL